MLTAPAPIGMYDMVCIDSSIYFIAASSSPVSPTANIFKTIDGGQTWTTLLDTIATFWAFDMANEQKGILVGGITGNILQTNDGWETTTLQFSGPPSVYYVAVHFLDVNTIFRGRIGGISRSVDGGETWSNAYGFNQIPSDIYHFSDSLLFVAGNYNSSKSQIIRSIDKGVTWVKVYEDWNDKLYDILFISENEGYVCGYNIIKKQGVLLYTYDGGDTWNKLWHEQDKRLGAIEQANDSILLIGGEDGLLLRFNRNQPLTGSRDVFQENNPIEVYPNPAASVLNISISTKMGVAIPAQLTVRNLLGQSCYLENITLGNTGTGLEIDVSAWPPGLYLLTLASGGQHWTEKIVVH